ncbi:MAG: UTP--glucose-1-phosphate uridylyltransferase [Planctomycetota bacterium]|jgi:UDP-N-acetylglucosamine/UDP-N-acetylgalactosamine diphosphorylase
MQVRALLEEHDQAHVLAFYDDLTPSCQESLLEQIEAIDFSWLGNAIEHYVLQRPAATVPEDLEPAPHYPHQPDDAATFRAAGEDLIRAGRVAAFTVAGGQGTRLGWNGPKGTFPATVVTGKPLFRVFAEQILAASQKYGARIPWYIMTSPLNDASTRAFFIDNNCFGLPRRDLFMFPQGTLPSLDVTRGRLLLETTGSLAVNPDGHGGSFRALHESGAIEDMLARGIEHISYFQVDNLLCRVIDPLFIGLHATAPDSSAEMSSKAVPKASPEERVGVFARAGGRTAVIEYSDLPETLARERDADGRLRFDGGNVAIHLVAVPFAQRVATSNHGGLLPLHRADKIVPFIDPKTGERVEPTEANAVKLELFVFDALAVAESSIVYETRRAEEFAPIKNTRGDDSPQTAHQLESDRNGSWLESKGVSVARDADGHVNAQIEISPLTALEADDLDAAALPRAIDVGDSIVL